MMALCKSIRPDSIDFYSSVPENQLLRHTSTVVSTHNKEATMLTHDKKMQLSLLSLRLTVFLVMLMWTIDKFVNPAHAASVYETFYFLSGLEPTVIYAIGALELVLLLLFLIGFQKCYTYGAVLILHAVSTFSSFGMYLTPFEGPNLLFFAAWPMLAACFTLFLLRDYDTMWTTH